MSTKGKSTARARVRTGVGSGRRHAAERQRGHEREPAACERCGAILRNRAWRRHARLPAASLDEMRWVVCPACEQQDEQRYCGRVLVAKLPPGASLPAVRARIANVASRAGRTQPERRVVSVEASNGGLEVLTTSQKLAHRVAKELAKAFGGRATYRWADDGLLLARWGA